MLRILTFIRGGDPYHNRLLEVANYFYGANTMLLVLRFSSVLELSEGVGPLQLALFRMLIDLVVILVQFFFVIIAFSLAITKSYIAEMSYMTSPNNQTGDLAKYNVRVFSAIFLRYNVINPYNCFIFRFHDRGSLKNFLQYFAFGDILTTDKTTVKLKETWR